MRTLSFFGSRGLNVLALTGGLVLAAASVASDEKATAAEPQTTSTTKSHQGLTTKSQTKSATQTQSQPDHPTHLHAALYELRKAHHQIREAHHDYAGHREHALKAVDHAMEQLEILIHHHDSNSPQAKKK